MLNRSPNPTAGVGRRTLLTRAGLVLTGTLAGSGAAVATDDYRSAHPSPSARVSPLVRSAPIAAPLSISWRGVGGQRRIALSFDDGPDPHWTPMVLDLLGRHGVPATFFMLGAAVRRHPDVARTVAQAGHEIGSHSWDHRHMTTQTGQQALDSLQRAHDEIGSVTGTAPTLMRPPYGQFDAQIAWAIASMRYHAVLWSHRMTSDSPAARVADTMATAFPGMITLSHDGRTTPTEEQMHAVEELIVALAEREWRFERVSSVLTPASKAV